MTVEVTSCGDVRTVDGVSQVEEVTLGNGVLTVCLLSLGAALRSLTAPDRSGVRSGVHLTLPEVADYANRERNPHLGSSIGRYANRIARSRFTLDGHEYELVANNGPNQLHGGPDGFDRHVWDLVDASGHERGGTVVFGLERPDGDQGFPGAVTAIATFDLDGPRLRIGYTATSNRPTVLNMTHHGYWNLDGRPTVADHGVALAADRYLPVDGAGIPTGALEPVGHTRFDLRRRTQLGPVLSAHPTGFDHCFALNGATDGASRILWPAAVLDAPASGRWMSVHTDQVGVQMYTGNGLGRPFRPHGSVSLETQMFPDTPNRRDLGNAVLRPGEEYSSLTELRFGVGRPPTLW